MTVFDAKAGDLTLGVVGAGVMGRGIAQIAALAGLRVLLADARAEAVEEGLNFAAGMIGRLAEKGKIGEEQADAARARLVATDAGPDAGYAAFADCDLVIEAVAERMDIKHAVLKGVEAAVRPDCVIATNTSSLSVTAFAAAADRPERVAGFHFFNPVPLMRIVEVIGGARTDPAVLDALCALAERMGHFPARATDTPGFLVNHAGRAYGTEAVRIVSEGIATFADIDRVMVEIAGFRMGPFELMDLTGLDVSHTVMEQVYHQYYEEPRFRPQPLTAQRFAAGLFGRKSGEGFYVYKDGRKQMPPEAAPPQGSLIEHPVWVGQGAEADVLAEYLDSIGIVANRDEKPGTEDLCLVAPYGADVTTIALRRGLDARHTVGIDLLFGLKERRCLMTSPVTASDYRDLAWRLFLADGGKVIFIHDSPGFIAQRILACIVNTGSDIAQQRIARPADINRAVELGLGYPKGPLAFGDALGPERILAILEEMQDFYGDPRYRPSPWLKRRALLHVPLLTEEA